MFEKTISVKRDKSIKWEVGGTLILLVSACLLPIIIHLIPAYNGIPIGAFLLPMFFIPFIAILYFRLYVGLITAVFAPVINFWISGSPDWQFLTVLSIELVLFSFFVFFLLRTKVAIIAAPLSYLLAKILSSIMLVFIPVLQVPPSEFFLNSITNGAPGIILLLILNWILCRNRN